MIKIRHVRPVRPTSPEEPRYGPKTADHIAVGLRCPACDVPFAPGDYTTIVVIGPGADPEAQDRARSGRSYNAVAVEAHFLCVTGHPPPADPHPEE